MANRPNIVLIITDQQRYDTIGALGFDYARTPHLDRFVREGVSFDNCFVNAPACGPARCSLFTGHWPHTTGMLRNGDPWQQTWVPRLSEAGYATANIGKMHFTPFDAQGQFDYRFNVENKQRFRQWQAYRDEWDLALARRGIDKYQREDLEKRQDYWIALGAFLWEKDPDLHPDNFVGGSACDWIRDYSADDPFFLEIGFPGPHPPYDPTPEWAALYDDVDIPLCPLEFIEWHKHPPALQEMTRHNTIVAHDSIKFVTYPSEAHRQRQRRMYMANVSLIDAQIGAIRATLEEKDLLDDTVIIITSDHGDTLTDHFSSQKWTMYDSVTRVPAIVWAPDEFDGGRRVEDLVQWFDLGATVLDIAGAAADGTGEAETLLPALRGDPFAGRQYVFSEHGREDVMGLHCHITMVRSADWKLVHFLDQPGGQLFDLQADPDECANLWEDPAHAAVRVQLMDVLGNWLIKSSSQASHWADAWR